MNGFRKVRAPRYVHKEGGEGVWAIPDPYERISESLNSVHKEGGRGSVPPWILMNGPLRTDTRQDSLRKYYRNYYRIHYRIYYGNSLLNP